MVAIPYRFVFCLKLIFVFYSIDITISLKKVIYICFKNFIFLLAKRQLIGVVRDLRGVAYAFNSKVSYMMLFDWIFPTYTPILLQALDFWYNDPQVTTPVLKLFAELAQNR